MKGGNLIIHQTLESKGRQEGALERYPASGLFPASVNTTGSLIPASSLL